MYCQSERNRQCHGDVYHIVSDLTPMFNDPPSLPHLLAARTHRRTVWPLVNRPSEFRVDFEGERGMKARSHVCISRVCNQDWSDNIIDLIFFLLPLFRSGDYRYVQLSPTKVGADGLSWDEAVATGSKEYNKHMVRSARASSALSTLAVPLAAAPSSLALSFAHLTLSSRC